MRGRVAWRRVVSEPRRKTHHKCWVIGLGAGEHGPRQSRAGGVLHYRFRLAFDLVDLAAGFFDLAAPGFRPNPIFSPSRSAAWRSWELPVPANPLAYMARVQMVRLLRYYRRERKSENIQHPVRHCQSKSA